MALGEMKLSRADFWKMTIREFVCAWYGHVRAETGRLEGVRNIVYGAHRYSSANVVGSMAGKKAAKSVANQRFEWEKSESAIKSKNPDEPLSYDDVKSIFNAISS